MNASAGENAKKKTFANFAFFAVNIFD